MLAIMLVESPREEGGAAEGTSGNLESKTQGFTSTVSMLINERTFLMAP